MSKIMAIWSREMRAFFSAYSTVVIYALFLTVSGGAFVFLLYQHEGSVLQVQTIWGGAVSLSLPLLCAVLSARLFAEERTTNMLDTLLVAPVRERDIVLGKFLAVYTVAVLVILTALLVPGAVLPQISPYMTRGWGQGALAATFLVLALQAALWCASGTLVSLFFRNQIAATSCSLLLTCGLPTILYFVVLAWVPTLRSELAHIPLLIHVYDFSTGLVSLGVVALYVIPALYFLFVCSKSLACMRLID